MRTRRRTLLATGLVALLTIAGITAAIANDPPPRIAFVANGIVPADALAAGPIAGQLGAPIYTTAPDFLVDSAAAALDAYNPELVIVMGGPAAISDAVLGQISEATGLSVVAPSPTPSSGIVRAAGEDRFQTAAAAAALLAAYDPAYLPTDMKAIDSDKLDGKDSSAFQPAGDYLGTTQKAADSDKLDGKDSSAFQLAGDYLADAPGSVVPSNLGAIPAARATGSGSITSGGSDKILSFVSEQYDVGGLWSSGAPTIMTAPIDGIYEINAGIRWSGNSTGLRGLYIQAAGDLVSLVEQDASAGSDGQNVSATIELAAGATASAWVYQNSGSTLSTVNNYTFLEMRWVAPADGAAGAAAATSATADPLRSQGQ